MLARFFTAPIKYFLFLGMGLYLLMHVAFIYLPPTGNHVWRQANSLAMAKNFNEEGMNILEPKIDKRFDGSGITGSSFPLYEWVLAIGYKIFGFSHVLHRIYALLLTYICFLLVYFNFKKRSESSARMAAWIFLFNPLVFYYGFSALPDMMAILFVLLANLCVYVIIERGGIVFKVLLPIVLSLGLLIKFTYILWLVVPFLIISSKQVRPKLIWLIPLILISGLPVYLWYSYANELTSLAQGNVEFVYYARFLSSVPAWKQLASNLLSVGTELYFGYPALLLIILGVVYGFKQKSGVKIHWFYKLGTGLLGLIYFISASKNLLDHDYYLLPFMSLLLLLLARVPNKRGVLVAIAFLLLMPLWSGVRIIPANWYGKDAHIWQYEKGRLSHQVKKTDRVVCGTDPSSCYLFYMLGVKGYPYRHLGELEEVKDGEVNIESYIRRGAKYLITNQNIDLENERLKQHFIEVQPLGTGLFLITLE